VEEGVFEQLATPLGFQGDAIRGGRLGLRSLASSSKQIFHQTKHQDIAWGKLVLQTATPTMLLN